MRDILKKPPKVKKKGKKGAILLIQLNAWLIQFSVFTLFYPLFYTAGSVNGIYILPSNDLLIPGFDTHHQGHYACVASFSGRECLRVEVDFGK